MCLKMKVPEGVVTIHFGEKKGLKALIKALKSHGSFSKVFKVSPMSHILHLLWKIMCLTMKVPEGAITIHFGEKNALKAMIKALKSHGNFLKVFKVSPISRILHLLGKTVCLKMKVSEGVVMIHFGEKNSLKAMIKALKCPIYYISISERNMLSKP